MRALPGPGQPGSAWRGAAAVVCCRLPGCGAVLAAWTLSDG